MKRSDGAIRPALLLLACAMAASCIGNKGASRTIEHDAHEDGTYRGSFIDRGLIQVNVQFVLRDGVVTEAAFRHLVGVEPEYHWTTEDEPYKSVIRQYEEALQYLVGKRLSDHLAHLYEPGALVTTQVDGYTGATIRAGKIISAFRDALNRGVYRYTDL